MKIAMMKSVSIMFLAFQGVSSFAPMSPHNGRVVGSKTARKTAMIDLSAPLNITSLNKGLCEDVTFQEGIDTIQKVATPKAKECNVDPEILGDLQSKSINELKLVCSKRSIRYKGLKEQEEFVQAIIDNMNELKDFSVSGRLVPGAFNEITGDILEEEMKSDLPLLLDIYATFCGPCKLVEPEFQVVARRLGKNCRVAKLDSQKYPEVANELKVQGLPATILIHKGRVVSRREGLVSREQLTELAEAYIPKKTFF